MDFGYVVKKTDDWYIVNLDLNLNDTGYGVVPRTEDPYNKYDIDDVKIYCTLNPDKMIDSDVYDQTLENKVEIERLKQYLKDTDYAVIKCSEQNLDLETEYPGLKDKRQEARTKINELEASLQ